MAKEEIARKEVFKAKIPGQQVATKQVTEVAPEQLAYAKIIHYGSLLGVVLLVLAFLLYVTGVLPPYISVEELPKFWGMNAHDFVAATKSPTGWGWTAYLGRGDYLCYLGIALLAGLTVIGYLLTLLPAYLKEKDLPYTVIVIAEILVLVLAASGIVAAGH